MYFLITPKEVNSTSTSQANLEPLFHLKYELFDK